MFEKHSVELCACVSLLWTGISMGAPSIADEPVHRLDEPPKGSLVDGTSHDVHTRLGKFGPMATVKLPPFKVAPRFESVTGYTDTGVPISRRKKLVIEQAKTMAAEWATDELSSLKAGRIKARPKVKTQADVWAEENARILADERAHGRKTTKHFVIPGMTPEQSDRLRKAKTGGVVIRGGVQIPTVLPTEEALASGEVKRIEPTHEQWAAIEARSESNQAEAFALRSAQTSGATQGVSDYFPDVGKGEKDQADPSIWEAFPDAMDPKHRSQTTPKRKSMGPLSANESPVWWHGGGVIEHGLQWLTGVSSAWAKQPLEVSPEISANPMAGAFDALAQELANDKAALDRRLRKHEKFDSSTPLESENDGVEGQCDHCRLTPADLDRASDVAKAVVKGTETQSVSARDAQVIAEITAVLNDPKHPASFLNMMREALEANPIVETHIPDARARLGLHSDNSETHTYVFVSYALGDDVLNDILKRHAGRNDVTIVMRGIPQGVSLGEGIKHMQRLASQYDPMPNIVLDPTLFQAYDVRAVPAVVKVEVTQGLLAKFDVSRQMNSGAHPQHPQLIAKVDGLHNDLWLNEKMAVEHCTVEAPCWFGAQGPVVEIAEPDMIEEMKRRVAQIDWEKKKVEAMKRFWTNQTFDALPQAEKSVKRVLDPSIRVVKDIVDANGLPIRRAGEIVNPLDARPFTSVLVIFNPMRELEMKTVLAKVATLRAQGHTQFIYMATTIDRTTANDDQALGPGWDHYKAVCDRLDSHVYLLTPEVKDRWAIRVTPTFVMADNKAKRFMIEEVAPQDVVGGRP